MVLRPTTFSKTALKVGMQRLEGLRSSGRRLNKVPASLRDVTQEVWAFAHPSDQTRWDYASQLSRERT